METAAKIDSLSTDRGRIARVVANPIFRWAALAGQLGLVLLAVYWYNLEGGVFAKLAGVTWLGYSIHYFLPARLRLPFFGLLSIAALVVIFGPAQAGWLVLLGFAVLGIAHLPIPFAVRVGILAVAAVLLGAMRAERLAFPWSRAIWPIFGSMFALRLIVYLYDLKHGTAPFSFWRAVAYFFMLPNSCFPLFPVVDYQTFCRTQGREADRLRVHQTGIDWMVRGAVHLLLYRLIYQNLPIDTSLVDGVPSLLRYLIWPFLLYLNVSGLFHLVVGMLHLFDFDLPETHHLFYLSSSFTDFWRRINIYWKDFMMKVFYYPAFFRLRRLGNVAALVLGTFVVFFATWALHSWQWFWLRGSMLIKGTDVLFWTILAVLVAVNVVIEARRPMARRLSSSAVPRRESAVKAVKSLGVFVAICLLWSLWVSDSAGDWLSLFSVFQRVRAADLRVLPAVLAFASVFLAIAYWFERRRTPPFAFARQASRNGAVLLLLFLVGSPRGFKPFGNEIAEFAGKLKSPTLSNRDVARRQRDYYEKLNDVGWENPELAKLYMVRPADWIAIIYRPDLAKVNRGLPYMEHVANARGRLRGVELRFNRWGMRDRDYPAVPEPGTYRIALVGQSHTYGDGVEQNNLFEKLVEDRLNREDRLGAYRRIEILNFAAANYTPLDILAAADKKIFHFQPHALLYVAHTIDAHRAAYRLSKLAANREPRTYPELEGFLRAGGVADGAVEGAALRSLLPRREELLEWAYAELVERCRSRGVVPLLAHLPLLYPQEYEMPVADLLGLARKAGFQTIDLSGVYAGRDRETLRVAPWDDHPNAQGHRLIADRLYAALRGTESSLWRQNDERRDQGTGAGVRSERVSSR